MPANLRIFQWRKRRGLTQSELSSLCETTQQTIAKIEMGVVDPKLSTLEKIAKALECELGELFYTRTEFAHDVNEVVRRLGIDLTRARSIDLYGLCIKEAFIPPFHPFWSDYKIKNNQIYFKKGKS